MPKPFTIQPNIKGSTLRLFTYTLDPDDPNLLELPGLIAELEGAMVGGFIFDTRRPELVTVQIEEGHPDHDLRWARRNLTGGMAVSRTVLEELDDGGAILHGSASRNLGDPTRYEFALFFGKGGR